LGPADALTAMPGSKPRAFSSGTPLERYVPLVDGHVYQYDYDDGAEARGVMTIRIKRFDDTHGAWVLPAGGNVFEYTSDGVVTEGKHGQSYVLKLPLEVGQRWRGSNQSWVEIKRVTASVTVPAGTFANCVETLEARGGDVPLSITASFCPDVGMVQRDIASGKRSEHLVLRSFGPPIRVGPDGLKILKNAPPEGE
jgi:hypothetical protein